MEDLNLIHPEPLSAPVSKWAREYKQENFPEIRHKGYREVSLISAWTLLKEEVPDDPWYGEPYSGAVPRSKPQLRWRKVYRATKSAISQGGRYNVREDMIRWVGDRPIPKRFRHYPRQLVGDFLPWLKEACDEKAPDQ